MTLQIATLLIALAAAVFAALSWLRGGWALAVARQAQEDADALEDAIDGYWDSSDDEEVPGLAERMDDAEDAIQAARFVADQAKRQAAEQKDSLVLAFSDEIKRLESALTELAKGPPSDGALKACVEELERQLASIRTGLALTAGVDPREPETVDPDGETETNIEFKVESVERDGIGFERMVPTSPGGLVVLPEGVTFTQTDDNAHASNDGFETPAGVTEVDWSGKDADIKGDFLKAMRRIDPEYEMPAPMLKFATEGVDV